MATSEARIAANRKNSLKSCGPKTESGKRRSRTNSLQHGLTAKVLRTAEEVELVGEPTPPPPGKLGSSPLDREWVVNEVELLAIRLRRAGDMEMKLRERSALRASICWDPARRSEAESIGSKLRKKPAEFAARLEETPQGCLWKIERWAMLARAADRDGGWSPEAHALAFDLQGIPHELRGGAIGEQVDIGGKIIRAGQDLGDFARLNVDRLMEVRQGLAEIDAFDRDTAQAGLAFDLGAEGLRLHRYESALQRRLRWYHDHLEEMPELSAPPREAAPPVEPPSRAVEGEGEGEVDEAIPLEVPPTPPTPTSTQPTLSRRDRRAVRAERRRLAAERKLARRLE